MTSINLLKQGIKNKIQINPFSLSGSIYPQKDNGYGQQIDDLSASAVATSYTNDIRIFRKKKNVKVTNEINTPYTYEEIYYMISDYETIVDTRLIFTYNSIKLVVKTREPIIKYGAIIGYQYELDEITEVEIA